MQFSTTGAGAGLSATARSIAGVAEQLAGTATRFAALDGVDWQGVAATGFRSRLRGVVAGTAGVSQRCGETVAVLGAVAATTVGSA